MSEYVRNHYFYFYHFVRFFWDLIKINLIYNIKYQYACLLIYSSFENNSSHKNCFNFNDNFINK